MYVVHNGIVVEKFSSTAAVGKEEVCTQLPYTTQDNTHTPLDRFSKLGYMLRNDYDCNTKERIFEQLLVRSFQHRPFRHWHSSRCGLLEL